MPEDYPNTVEGEQRFEADMAARDPRARVHDRERHVLPRVPVVAEDAPADEDALLRSALSRAEQWLAWGNEAPTAGGVRVSANDVARDVGALTEALRVAWNERDEALAQLKAMQPLWERHEAVEDELAALRVVADRQRQAISDYVTASIAEADHAAAYDMDAVGLWPEDGLRLKRELQAAYESLAALLVDGPADENDPGCARHRGDPHNLCQACWEAETDPSNEPSDAPEGAERNQHG